MISNFSATQRDVLSDPHRNVNSTVSIRQKSSWASLPFDARLSNVNCHLMGPWSARLVVFELVDHAMKHYYRPSNKVVRLADPHLYCVVLLVNVDGYFMSSIVILMCIRSRTCPVYGYSTVNVRRAPSCWTCALSRTRNTMRAVLWNMKGLFFIPIFYHGALLLNFENFPFWRLCRVLINDRVIFTI